MIKKLSELKISPAPWRVSDAQNYWIEDANRKMICDGLTYRGNDESADAEERGNARLIAAAPKMYDRAQKLVAAFDRREMTPGHIEALRAALAEAAGEEVSDGKC